MSAAAADARVVVLATPPVTPTFNGERSLTRALEHAYYQGDIDTIRRIAAQVEQRLQALGQPREAA